MEVNFGAGATPVDAPATEQQAASAVTAQSPNTNTAVARPLMGDFLPQFRDVILPALQIAHPVGEVGKIWTHGSVVYDGRLPLFVPADFDVATGTLRRAATAPFIVTFLGFQTPQYTEKVAGGARGLILNSEAAVSAAGGTLDYNEWMLKKAQGMKYFQPVVKSMVAIQRPDACPDDGSTFVHEINGAKYTLAFWTFKASAYTAACKRVVFPAKLTGCLQKGYSAFSFEASTRLTPFSGGNAAWLPVLKPSKASTPELLAFVDKVLKG